MDNTVLYIGGAAATAALSVAGWAFRTMHGRIGELEKDVAGHKLHCAETFVTNSALEKAIDRFSTAIDAVYKKLEKIDDRLAEKADKP